jgi:dCMP deaminase
MSGPTDLKELLLRTYTELAAWSEGATKDPHSSAAAAIVAPSGELVTRSTNRLPSGVTHEHWRWNKPQRYLYVEMAPRAAIYAAARAGQRLAGNWIVTTVFPVADDARAIIESGLAGLASPEPDLTDRVESEYYASAQTMLYESAVQLQYLGR